MIDRYKEVLGEDATVLATGGLAQSVACHCRRELVIAPDLISDGLYVIYKKNAE